MIFTGQIATTRSVEVFSNLRQGRIGIYVCSVEALVVPRTCHRICSTDLTSTIYNLRYSLHIIKPVRLMMCQSTRTGPLDRRSCRQARVSVLKPRRCCEMIKRASPRSARVVVEIDEYWWGAHTVGAEVDPPKRFE